ncbi:MAG: Pvc16 family protein, partial [Gammaproteobacteria bacterium]
MALRNLYKVTKTLTDLLTQNITKNIDTSLDGQLTVTAIPPDTVENPSNTLSLHLYHVAEDPYYKNALGPGSDVPNVAKAPMALSLFYILTAHHELDPAFDAEAQQKLMGYALKTFHDFPVITDRTRINGTDILDED